MVLLYSNLLPHAIVIVQTPCSPQYLSSLILPCNSHRDRLPYLYTLPFFAVEMYAITVVLFLFAFAWSVIFLGFGWVLREMRALQKNGTKCNLDTIARYIRSQRLAHAINSCMRLYLSTYHSVMMIILALLLFGCVRLMYLDFRANIMFPVCWIRCGFESLSPMAVAGKVNSKSKSILAKWEKGWKKKEDRVNAKSWNTFPLKPALCIRYKTLFFSWA